MPERSPDVEGGTGHRAADSFSGSAPGRRRSLRDEVLGRLVRAALDDQVTKSGRSALRVVDAGGGTGHLAVPIARLGHQVTVVDPSPDSLAALERRAAEARVTERVQAVQGDATSLRELLGETTTDLVLCHSVLEVVDDPQVALHAMASVLRAGGALSLVAANRYAAVLAKVLGGHLDQARAALDAADDPADTGPTPRRFTPEQLRGFAENAGLEVVDERGVRVFADLLPAGLADEPGATAALLDLEERASAHPKFRVLSAQLHLLARRH